MSVNERFKRVAFELKLSQIDLALICDVSKQAISQILNGASKPGFRVIETNLIKYKQLNARWLLTGN